VYFLNQKGRELIGSLRERKYSLEVEHYLLRNDMYIHFGCPEDFKIEQEIVFKSGLTQRMIRPDAVFTLKGVYHLLEVDRTQNMTENKKKINLYAELSPLISLQYRHLPSLIFYTLTPTRKKSISARCKENGIHFNVIAKEDIL
jgi:hypothetical protein